MTPNNSADFSRRTFLQRSSLAAAAVAANPVASFAQGTEQILGAEEAKAPTKISEGAATLRALFHSPGGKPLDSLRIKTLHARDLANDPLPQAIVIAEGRARIALAPHEPLQLSCRLNVPGFGEVYCYADNNGLGYSKPETIEFVVAACETRLHRVREAADAAKKSGVPSDPVFEKYLQAASRPISKRSGAEQIAVAYEALANGLHAGEKLALNMARHRISKFAAPRKDFLLGAAISGWQRGGEFEKHFLEAFNFGTISWYSWSQKPDPVEQRIDYARMDQSIQWCLDRKIIPRGFGYVYLTPGATPEWFRAWPYEKILPEYKRIVEMTTRRYHGRLPYVEVINEAHDKANLFHLSHQQILELAREACRSARAGSSTVKRMINNCCAWAEYAVRSNADGARRWSPFRFLSDCMSAGVEFEVVGLQLYYPKQDLFEIERMLDRFKKFQRPIMITEIACNSVDGLDAASMRPKDLVPGWHGPWTETMQADWLEGIYTMLFSKPEFAGIGWWDFCDGGGHFWPNGALLRKDLSPKESFLRLLKLQKDWGVARV